MKVRTEKFRTANVGRIVVSVIVLLILFFFRYMNSIVLSVSLFHLFFSIVWIFLIETDLVSEKKNPQLGIFPLFLDILLSTILMYITGNIFSFFAIGYIVLTGISSINPKYSFGVLSIILSMIFFIFMGLLIMNQFIPNINILSKETAILNSYSFALSIISILSGLMIVNFLTTQFIDYNKKLNSQMKGQKLKLENYLKGYKKDLDLAKKVQRSLLTNDFQERENIKIKIRFAPMNEVGGDIYDIYEIRDGLIRVFIADATGHGVQAALVTMAIKSEYENFKSVIESPGDLLQIMNSYFTNKYKFLKTYFSCVVADIYLHENFIRYASAGHPSQICFVDNKIVHLENTGRLICLSDQSMYTTKVFYFTKPTRFLFFTDGIFESFSNDIDPFGEESFHNYLLENPNFNTDKLTEKIETIKSQLSQKDDILLVSVKLSE